MGKIAQLRRHNVFLLPYLVLVFSAFPRVRSGDAESLLSLKASIDPSDLLRWVRGSDLCKWKGVKQCLNGRVTKLVVENLNLSGTLDGKSLNLLDQLRVLSFKENSLSGHIPELFGLKNLKSLFLNDNKFSGGIPNNVTLMHRLKIIDLSGNRISGQIPRSLVDLPRLYTLYLQDNQLTGDVPAFDQNSLRFFNVSNNALSGEIPKTPSLLKFNNSSFSGNINLCGQQIQKPCDIIPSPSPSNPTTPTYTSKHHKRRKKLILIIALTVGGFVALCIVTILLIICLRKASKETESRNKVVAGGVEEAATSVDRDNNNSSSKQGGLSWDQGGDGLGNLVFLGPGGQQMNYSLEDLLKASAETLGRGTVGSTYKAVMESGYIVTVKRLKESRYPRMEEFRRHIEIVGRLRHPNLVPLRAYFQAKEERLLVYDYFPNGSLFSLVHGSRGSAGSKPLHWTSCLKIAEDLAAGLHYIHQNPGLTHGNLKSTNVLLGPEFESCLTDYALTPFRNPESLEESSAASLFYRAPECRDLRRPTTQQADVYSYGVLLLELLTGKTPFQDLVQEYGSDIPRWVKSVRSETTDSGDEPASSNDEKMNALLNIAVSCVSVTPESRPVIGELLRMIREARTEAQVSSNSSDHSPGRWSDTVQSLPREGYVSI
ncbi:inactive leucine-rich repeat receptor-like serine/threonine-protein kinase [Dorcoceras hygrometricum]|uniref:Inactive leucine-rich repeat receptor-like serine/threonine-protein kinase n=1 Tax=Dorcoceras hygrometricum TaxID=472368 RepID=A0A2Z7BVX1_9LAMI|nr:inactive leucine-rich repeat receptor-like serine/threonine-protein kinase [Dorcoceras hygrometricum]